MECTEWLQRAGKSENALSKETGIPRTNLRRYLHDGAPPPPDAVLAIQIASGGLVTLSDWTKRERPRQ